MNVLVLDGNENQAVACTRALARAGHRVSVGADTSWSKAGWSRACTSSFVYPSPQRDVNAFIERIAAQIDQTSGALIVPMTERSTLPISEHRARLISAGARLVLPPHEVVLRAFDKAETTRLAQEVGLTVPNTTALDARIASPPAHGLRYPVVLKPRMSEERDGTGVVRTTGAPVYARTPTEFADAWGRLRQRCDGVLVQEFVEGVGTGYFAILDHGAIRAEFAHRRLRDVRPTGSGSALRVSIPLEPRMTEGSRLLLSRLHWHGVAMVEFRLRPDGTPVFLEVNGRFWNSLALAIHAGVDFPAMVADLAERGSLEGPAPAFQPGVRCRWLLGDVRHLLEVWRGAPDGYPGRFPSRVRTLLEVLRPHRNTWHDNFELRDPWPEVGDWLHFMTRKLPAARRRPLDLPETQHA